MADYLFVPQSVLDKWSEQGRIQVDGNVLTILGEQKSFALTSAVRFIKMEAGEDDVEAPSSDPVDGKIAAIQSKNPIRLEPLGENDERGISVIHRLVGVFFHQIREPAAIADEQGFDSRPALGQMPL